MMNESDSKEPAENCLVNFSRKNLKKKKQSIIINFADKITALEQKKYDTLLARAIYAYASLFSMVKNPHWKSFFNAIRPAYVVPSRCKISEPFLDSKYDKIEVETVAKIAASDSVRLTCDGWSNIRNEPNINFVVSQPKPIFWKSFRTDLQNHTGKHVVTDILKVIEELESECGKMVFGVVTDNASNMKKAWRIVKEKYPTIKLSAMDVLRMVSN